MREILTRGLEALGVDLEPAAGAGRIFQAPPGAEPGHEPDGDYRPGRRWRRSTSWTGLCLLPMAE